MNKSYLQLWELSAVFSCKHLASLLQEQSFLSHKTGFSWVLKHKRIRSLSSGVKCFRSLSLGGEGMAQCWERLVPTNVRRVLFRPGALCVFSLCSASYSPGSSVFLPPKNERSIASRCSGKEPSLLALGGERRLDLRGAADFPRLCETRDQSLLKNITIIKTPF